MSTNERIVTVGGLEFRMPTKRRVNREPVKSRWPGRKVSALRRALGLTQGEFAGATGFSWTSVSRWENDRTRVPEALAKLFDEWEAKLHIPLSAYVTVEEVKPAGVVQPHDVDHRANDLGTYLKSA